MQEYVIRRFLQFIPTLFTASVLIFLIIQLAPGDPAITMLPMQATDEQIEAERVRLGLDRPLSVRYAIWLSDMLRLNLGRSHLNERPVKSQIARVFPNTLRLALTALSLSVLVGFSMGAVAALRQDSPVDTFITGLNSLGLSIPSFWLGILMIMLFSVKLKWLPPSGVGAPGKSPFYNLQYIIMPVLTIAFSNTSVFSRFVRSTMIDVMGADYIRTARAKGLRERLVITHHALKNAMIPIVTIVGMQFGRLLSGAVITESVFAYSGVGRLVVVAIRNRDYPVVQGTLILIVLIFLVTNLMVDLTYGYLDPRVRLSG